MRFALGKIGAFGIMFATPMAVVKTMRAAIAVLIIGILLTASASGVGAAALTISGSSIVAAVGAGMLMPMLAIAFPWNRKLDLLYILLGAILLVTLGRYAAGSTASIWADCLSAFTCALLTYCAFGAEKLRGRSRKFGNVLFDVIEIEDRRQAKRRKRTRPEIGNRANNPAIVASQKDETKWPSVGSSFV